MPESNVNLLQVRDIVNSMVDLYARRKPAAGQIGLFDDPSEKQRPLFSKKPEDDKSGRWLTMRGVHVFVSGDDGRIMKGPKHFVGKTVKQIEGLKDGRSSEGAGDEKKPKPKGLNELGKISGGRAENRQQRMFETLNPGFDFGKDFEEKTGIKIDDIPIESTDDEDDVPSQPEPVNFRDDEPDEVTAEEGEEAEPEEQKQPEPAETQFTLSRPAMPKPPKPDFGTNDKTKQGGLFDAGKKGELKGQELLFNSDAGDLGNPKTMENKVKANESGKSSDPISNLTDDVLHQRAGYEFEQMQKAFGVKKPAMGKDGTKKVQDALRKIKGGNVIAAMLATGHEHAGKFEYDNNGFPRLGNDAFSNAIDGKFSKEDLNAAKDFLETTYSNSGEFGNVNQYRWLSGVARTAKPLKEHEPESPSPSSAVKPDQAVVNLPLSKRGNGSLNAQIDRLKKETAKQKKADSKAFSDKFDAAKKQASEMFSKHGESIADSTVKKHGVDKREAMKTMREMVSSNPEQAVKFFKKWEKDNYARQQIDFIVDKYLRNEKPQIDHYAHPLVHAAVGGAAHLTAQVIVPRPLRKIAHAVIAGAMAAWLANAQAGMMNQQAPQVQDQSQQGQFQQAPQEFQPAKLNPMDSIINQAFQKYDQKKAAEQSAPPSPAQQAADSAIGKAGQAAGVPGMGQQRPLKERPDIQTAGKGSEAGPGGQTGHPDGIKRETEFHDGKRPGEFAPKDGGSGGGESDSGESVSENPPPSSAVQNDSGFDGDSSGGNDDWDNTKLTIQQASNELQNHGYKLGSGNHDLKTKKTSYDLQNPDGSMGKMSSDQLKKMIHSWNKPASEQQNYAPPERAIEPTDSEPQQQKSHADIINAHISKALANSSKTVPSENPRKSADYQSNMFTPADVKEIKQAERTAKKEEKQQAAEHAERVDFNPDELEAESSADKTERQAKKDIIPDVASEHGLDHDLLHHAVNEELQSLLPAHQRQEEARQYISKLGWHAGRINRAEDSYKDHTTMSGINKFASEWAGLFPEIAGQDEHDWMERMWNLSKQGKQDAPSANDEDLVRSVAKRLVDQGYSEGGNFYGSGVDSGDNNPLSSSAVKGSEFNSQSDLDSTPFCRSAIGMIVDKYLRIHGVI